MKFGIFKTPFGFKKLAWPSADSAVPVAWAGSTSKMKYLNLGDALSPIMVALLTGLPIERVSTKSKASRLAAVGTIGHGFAGGEVWFWGTGASPWQNPQALASEKIPYSIPENSSFHVQATRGPTSESLLTGGNAVGSGVYGDPVWLLPRFYNPQVKKKWKIGVILHLSELADREFEPHPRPEFVRFNIPDHLKDDVHLITTVAPIKTAAVGQKIDEILACERIVSTSLHGMVIAESYNIPCLYFDPNGDAMGVTEKPVDLKSGLDPRIVDLYQGLSKTRLKTYVQPRDVETDWPKVCAAIDAHWEPVTMDECKLVGSLPLPLDPVYPKQGKSIWQHPVVKSIQLQHDVSEVRMNDSEVRAEQEQNGTLFRTLGSGFNQTDKEDLAKRLMSKNGSIPLSWAATTTEKPYSNLGDALGAVVVSALSGLPVRHAHFDEPKERLVGVGTIGHAQKYGKVHFWGTGLDASRNPVDPKGKSYETPPNSRFVVHATRGPKTRETLVNAGVLMPDVPFGDPVFLLPEIWPMTEVKRKWDIGIIVHVSELEMQTPEAMTKSVYQRYKIPKEFEDRVVIINTLTLPTLDALKEKMSEIVSCRTVLSTSLHGLVIAEAYKIPCAWFKTTGKGTGARLSLADDRENIDHRFRDYYLGAGATHLLSFCQDRTEPTDWKTAIDYVTETWTPMNPNLEPLVDAFPLPLAQKDSHGLWPLSAQAAATMQL